MDYTNIQILSRRKGYTIPSPYDWLCALLFQCASDVRMVSFLRLVVQRSLCLVILSKCSNVMDHTSRVCKLVDGYHPITLLILFRPYDRPQLNERPIYLRTNFYLLAIIQTCWHLYYDYDRVVLPYQRSHSSNGESQVISSPEEQLKSKLPRRAERTFLRSLCMVILGPLIYQLFLRRVAWKWTMFLAAKVWALPRSSSIPPSVLPYHISVILRTVTSSYMLLMLWEISNLSFGIYVAQEPLKKDKPLTDYTRDPNGTLLTGLKSKREVSRVSSLTKYLS